MGENKKINNEEKKKWQRNCYYFLDNNDTE